MRNRERVMWCLVIVVVLVCTECNAGRLSLQELLEREYGDNIATLLLSPRDSSASTSFSPDDFMKENAAFLRSSCLPGNGKPACPIRRPRLAENFGESIKVILLFVRQMFASLKEEEDSSSSSGGSFRCGLMSKRICDLEQNGVRRQVIRAYVALLYSGVQLAVDCAPNKERQSVVQSSWKAILSSVRSQNETGDIPLDTKAPAFSPFDVLSEKILLLGLLANESYLHRKYMGNASRFADQMLSSRAPFAVGVLPHRSVGPILHIDLKSLPFLLQGPRAGRFALLFRSEVSCSAYVKVCSPVLRSGLAKFDDVFSKESLSYRQQALRLDCPYLCNVGGHPSSPYSSEANWTLVDISMGSEGLLRVRSRSQLVTLAPSSNRENSPSSAAESVSIVEVLFQSFEHFFLWIAEERGQRRSPLHVSAVVVVHLRRFGTAPGIESSWWGVAAHASLMAEFNLLLTDRTDIHKDFHRLVYMRRDVFQRSEVMQRWGEY